VNGAADYHADCCDSDSGLWRLLGRVYALLPYRFHVILNDLELDGPRNWELARAAASNLRYGRDLNFYCCFRTHLRAEDIGVQRRKARDRWEVANLVSCAVIV